MNLSRKRGSRMALSAVLAATATLHARGQEGYILQPGLQPGAVSVADEDLPGAFSRPVARDSELDAAAEMVQVFRPRRDTQAQLLAGTVSILESVETHVALSTDDGVLELTPPSGPASPVQLVTDTKSTSSHLTISKSEQGLRWQSHEPPATITAQAAGWSMHSPFPAPPGDVPHLEPSDRPLPLAAAPAGEADRFITQPETTEMPQSTPTPARPRVSSAAADVSSRARAQLASQISAQIIGPENGSVTPPLQNTLDDAPGWQAVGDRLRHHLHRCRELVERGAFFSARDEVQRAAVYLVRTLDAREAASHCERHWLSAQRALVEAEEFVSVQRLSSEGQFLRRLIDSHRTPVLKQVAVNGLSPVAAARQYQDYAEESMVRASQAHPWASEVLYALGRTYQAQAAQLPRDQTAECLLRRAIVHYRAAVRIDPSNALAGNQLGFSLLQLDQPRDAQQVLMDSLRSRPTLEGFQNLVEASRRLGDTHTYNLALQQVFAWQQHSTGAESTATQVFEISPQVFAASSPYQAGPRSAAALAGRSQSTTSPAAR